VLLVTAIPLNTVPSLQNHVRQDRRGRRGKPGGKVDPLLPLVESIASAAEVLIINFRR